MKDITYDWEFQSNLYYVRPVVVVKLPGNYWAFAHPNNLSLESELFRSRYVNDNSNPAPESEGSCP